MGDYVQDNYFTVDLNLEFKFYLANPQEAFDSKDYKAADSFFSDPSAIDKIFEQFASEPGMEQLKDTFQSLMNQPLSTVASITDVQSLDEESKKRFQKLIPVFSADTTLLEFWKSNLSFSTTLMEDYKELTELRKYISLYINREDYSWEKWKKGFNQKLKSTTLNKTFLELVELITGPLRENNTYSKLTNTYTLLEMLNVTQERNKRGLKKFTFSSLNQDAQHVYYASFTDYLVTDDRGMQLKAHIVYQLYNIPTEVLSIQDFLNKNHSIKNNEETLKSFFNTLKYDIKHAFKLFSKPDLLTDSTVDTYKTTHLYFNYFNRFQIFNLPLETQLAMYCERRSYSNFVMFREIEILVNKLLLVFGIDEKKGKYDIKESIGEHAIRMWTIRNTTFRLVHSANIRGNYICLHFTVPNEGDL
jgi:hypothetical protein